MLRLMRRSLALLLLLGLVGCSARKPSAPKPRVIGFPRGDISDGTKRAPRLIGRVAMVNRDANFVLISCDAWTAPREGTALKCVRNTVETAVLNVSPERRGAYVTADIVTGEPTQGDQVFQ